MLDYVKDKADKMRRNTMTRKNLNRLTAQHIRLHSNEYLSEIVATFKPECSLTSWAVAAAKHELAERAKHN